MRFPSHDRDNHVLHRQLDSVSAAIATGKRPAPFRTRKLSPSPPRVLPGGGGGRVGRPRTYFAGGAAAPSPPPPETPGTQALGGATATPHFAVSIRRNG